MLYISQLPHVFYKLRPYLSPRCDQHLAKSKIHEVPDYVNVLHHPSRNFRSSRKYFSQYFVLRHSKSLLLIYKFQDLNIGHMTQSWCLRGFPKSSQANAGMVDQIRPRPPPFISFPVHYSYHSTVYNRSCLKQEYTKHKQNTRTWDFKILMVWLRNETMLSSELWLYVV
jgi:hypothetical protein